MNTPEFVLRRTRKWNRVTKFINNACDAPWTTYAETMFPAAGKAIITLLSFGLDDVARGYLRPHGVYKQKCLGRGKRGRNAVGIPELGEEIGKRLPGVDAVKAREYSAAEKKLWLLDGVSQRVLFWFMVVDVVTDFAYDWVTGIYKKEFCEDHNTSQFVTTGFKWRHGYPPDFGEQLAVHGTYDTIREAEVWNGREVSFYPGKSGSAFAQWTFTTDEFGFCVMAIRLVLLGVTIIDGERVLGPEIVQERAVIMGPNETKTVSLSLTGKTGIIATYPLYGSLFDRVESRLDVFQTYGT